MALVNPVKVGGVEPANTRKTILDLVVARYRDAIKGFGTDIGLIEVGLRPLNSISTFPAVLFVSSGETFMAKYLGDMLDFEFTITLLCFAQAENPDLLDEQLNNFVHAVKKVAYIGRDEKFGDTNNIITDAIPSDIRDVNEFLPLTYVGFEFDIKVQYRVNINDL